VAAEERAVIYAVTIGGFLLVSGFFLLGVAMGRMIGRGQVYDDWTLSLERERLERSQHSKLRGGK